MRKKNPIVIHPGEFLAEMLADLNLSQAAFSRAIRVSPMRISHVVKGARPVTAELALLFGRAFGQSPQYWLNLQADHDLKAAAASIGPRLRAIHAVTHADARAAGPCAPRVPRPTSGGKSLAGFHLAAVAGEMGIVPTILNP
jgi:addiction module HigA family antidote